VGIFDSKSTTNNEQNTDNRTTQAGNDVSQSSVNITTGKKGGGNNINITETDHNAIAEAFGFGSDALDSSLSTVGSLVNNMSDMLGSQQRQNSASLERLAISSNTNGATEVINGNIKMVALLLVLFLVGTFIYIKVVK